jgi:putative Holliday junction resolvase
MKYLAIDYGLRHLGLAVNFDSLAEPMAQIDYRREEEAVKRLAQICLKEQIEGIVVGLSEGKMADRTRSFAKRLSAETGLDVEFEDETLTSQEAKRRLIEAGAGRTKRSKKDHQAAAALVLQAFLDRTTGTLLE